MKTKEGGRGEDHRREEGIQAAKRGKGGDSRCSKNQKRAGGGSEKKKKKRKTFKDEKKERRSQMHVSSSCF